MKTREYAKSFDIRLKDGTSVHVKKGKQKVTDEVVDSTFAQHHQVDVPEELTAGRTIPYGAPGHEVQAFESRDLGDDDEVEDNGIDQEIPEEPGQDGESKGPSSRAASARRRAVTSE